MKALREMEADGAFTLPVARTRTGPKAPVPVPEAVPADVGAVRRLRPELVTTASQIRVWNELMCREHPRGAGPLVGWQLRYLIGSAHGWLGGLGVECAAKQGDAWEGECLHARNVRTATTLLIPQWTLER